ncbi:MAG: hypothetical protein HY367_03890 [Candidatus Aenigmarchaeota archaeon]|nr:hypothetical protein [Candidatus Aenigmarchaeota archaeon]
MPEEKIALFRKVNYGYGELVEIEVLDMPDQPTGFLSPECAPEQRAHLERLGYTVIETDSCIIRPKKGLGYLM